MLLGVVRSVLFVSIALGGAGAAQVSTAPGQAAAPDLAGVWVLNPALTQRPDEIGFNLKVPGVGTPGGGGSSGGRSRRGGSGSSSGAVGVPQISREGPDDSTRRDQLTGDARTPPSQLAIVQKDSAISIADDQGRSRTFHPDGKLETLTLGTVPLPTTTRWNDGSLVVTYDVETDRQLRYTYTRTANPSRLLVDIRFIERGREGDEVRLTYEPPDAHDAAVLSGATAPPAAAPASPASNAPAAAPASAPPPVLPPGSELRGLTTIGTVVENLSGQATACGLDQAKIKTSVAGILTAGGFKADPFGRENGYVLVNVVTSRLPDGTCVSRYDASLMVDADATLTYLKGLVSVEIPLLHEGGMAGGSPAQHAKAITDGLAKSVTSFVAQIHAANK